MNNFLIICNLKTVRRLRRKKGLKLSIVLSLRENLLKRRPVSEIHLQVNRNVNLIKQVRNIPIQDKSNMYEYYNTFRIVIIILKYTLSHGIDALF